jgi:hypothetical protein
VVATVPSDNARSFVEPGWRPRVLGPVVRAGARLGALAPPQVWRQASVPLIAHLRGRDDAHRPRLSAEQRARLVPAFTDDIELLCEVTGQDFSDWLSTTSRGSFRERAMVGSEVGSGQPVSKEPAYDTLVSRSWAPSARAASK